MTPSLQLLYTSQMPFEISQRIGTHGLLKSNAKMFPNHKKTINLEDDFNVEKVKK
jgi:hypothetical protein